MLYGKTLLERNNYDIIKTVKLGELPEKIKNIFHSKFYITDDSDTFELYKNKETGDSIYASCTSLELYLDTLDGEPYDDLTKHETFKDYVYIQDNYDGMYEHKNDIDTLIRLDVVIKNKDKYYSYNYEGDYDYEE